MGNFKDTLGMGMWNYLTHHYKWLLLKIESEEKNLDVVWTQREIVLFFLVNI